MRSYLWAGHPSDGDRRTQGLKESHGCIRAPKFRARYLEGDMSRSPIQRAGDGGDSPMGHAHDISIERILGFYEGMVRIQSGRSEE